MFILLTPVHNEADQIEELVQCILQSSLRPDIWLIIDDCSNDGTDVKLVEIQKNINFLKVIRLNEKAEYMEFNYSEVLRAGIKELDEQVNRARYIGILDADIRFGQQYWQMLKQALDENERTGIVSGTLASRNKDGKIMIEPFQRIDNPRGGLRLIKGVCFQDINGIQRSRAPDSIQNVKARLSGWEIRTLINLYALSTRPTDDKLGKSQGEISRGRRDWHLHQPVWLIIVRATAKVIQGDIKTAYHYISGYIREWLRNGEKYPDNQVRRYYRSVRLSEWIYAIQCKIAGKPNPHRLIPLQEVFPDEIFTMDKNPVHTDE